MDNNNNNNAKAAPAHNQNQNPSPTASPNPNPSPSPSPRPASPIQPNFAPSQEFIKGLGLFFQRDIIAIPLVKRINHSIITQRCGLKGAILELDTSCYPNLDYIAGNRLSIYPMNQNDQVNAIMRFIINDITGPRSTSTNQQQARQSNVRLSDPWEYFVQLNGRESIKLALLHIYDIMTAPSRDFLRVMSVYCSNKEHKARANAISGSDESWEKWVCSGLRTLKTTFEEFNSCLIPAKVLFTELTLQQPRQYSISNIKSRKRFRTEIVVIQHRFTTKQIGITLQNIKEREANEKSSDKVQHQHINADLNNEHLHKMKSHPTSVRVGHNEPLRSARSSASIRSLRSVATFGTSPISTQQVSKVPAYSGKLMSMYSSSLGISSNAENNQPQAVANPQQLVQRTIDGVKESNSKSLSGPYHDGLCSNYLLGVMPSDYIICEFVENPRFTLKGNRERPIMMIGQGIGSLAFRAFWQQRALEHDRAQMFYTLFKDLSPKKFGDLHLVHLTGNKCKIEELFKREILQNLEHKVLTSVIDLEMRWLQLVIDSTISSTFGNSASKDSLGSLVMAPTQQGLAKQTVKNFTRAAKQQQQLQQTPQSPRPVTVKQALQQMSTPMRNALFQKDLYELGNRLSKLLIDNNGCLYTCCDLAMTQAIEILIVESVVRNHPSYTRDQILAMLTKWKGNTLKYQHQVLQGAEGKKYLFTLENPFERAQIVQEIYDETL